MPTPPLHATCFNFRRSIRRLALVAAVWAAGSGLTAQPDDPYANAIKSFVEQDQSLPTLPKGGILFAGSSTITIWNPNLARDFPDLNVIGRGFGGSTIPDQLRHIQQAILARSPSLIVFYCGENDINSGRSPQQVADDFATLCDQVFARLPESRILYVGMKPSPIRWHLQPKFDEGNDLIERYAARSFRIAYLDIKSAFLGADGLPRPELYYKDKLHLSPEGYKILQSLVAPHLSSSSQ